MAEKDNYKTAATVILGAISASLVLFPSILGVVSKPLVGGWILWLYLFSGLIAFVSMTYVYYRAAFVDGDMPVRASGVGALAAVVSILSFAAYLFANLISDQVAPPVITNLSSNGPIVSPGDALTLTVHGEDQNGDRLMWTWRVEPVRPTKLSHAITLPSRLDGAVWLIPQTAEIGVYTVRAIVSDGKHVSRSEIIQIEIRKKS